MFAIDHTSPESENTSQQSKEAFIKKHAADIAAALEAAAAAKQKKRDSVILDPSKEYTGEIDGLGNPIYNGSILCLCSGYEGYWQVFKNNAGEWMKKSLNIYNVDDAGNRTIEPLREFLGYSEVVEDAQKHANKMDELMFGETQSDSKEQYNG